MTGCGICEWLHINETLNEKSKCWIKIMTLNVNEYLLQMWMNIFVTKKYVAECELCPCCHDKVGTDFYVSSLQIWATR